MYSCRPKLPGAPDNRFSPYTEERKDFGHDGYDSREDYRLSEDLIVDCPFDTSHRGLASDMLKHMELCCSSPARAEHRETFQYRCHDHPEPSLRNGQIEDRNRYFRQRDPVKYIQDQDYGRYLSNPGRHKDLRDTSKYRDSRDQVRYDHGSYNQGRYDQVKYDQERNDWGRCDRRRCDNRRCDNWRCDNRRCDNWRCDQVRHDQERHSYVSGTLSNHPDSYSYHPDAHINPPASWGYPCAPWDYPYELQRDSYQFKQIKEPRDTVFKRAPKNTFERPPRFATIHLPPGRTSHQRTKDLELSNFTRETCVPKSEEEILASIENFEKKNTLNIYATEFSPLEREANAEAEEAWSSAEFIDSSKIDDYPPLPSKPLTQPSSDDVPISVWQDRPTNDATKDESTETLDDEITVDMLADSLKNL